VRKVRARSDQVREGFFRKHARGASFCQLVHEFFFDEPGDAPLSGKVTLPVEEVARLGAEVAAEITNRRVKGTVYVGGDGELARGVLRALPQRPMPGLRIGKLSALEGPGFCSEVSDPRLADLDFFVAMTELGGYALVARERDDAFDVFHTVELELVDAFVTSLQRAYHFQPEIG